jgi:rhamnosyltransferase
MTSVAVIMRTKNAEATVAQALKSLFSQTRPVDDVLVVDSGSTDRTVEIAQRFPCRIVRIEASSYVPGPVLNDAIAATSADVVVFQNSDVVLLRPDALEQLLKPLEVDSCVASFARQLPRPEADTWVRDDYARAFPPDGPAPSWMTYSLPFAALRRTAWQQQPFWTTSWGSEDTAWGTSARAQNWGIAYVPAALVMHSHNYTLRQLYGRRFIEGEADAFMANGRRRWWSLPGRWVRSVLRDAIAHVRAGDVAGLLQAPVRRFVFHWGWQRGNEWGAARRRRGVADTSVGQQTVLSRYSA